MSAVVRSPPQPHPLLRQNECSRLRAAPPRLRLRNEGVIGGDVIHRIERRDLEESRLEV
jgi:hypothetical protein